MAALSWKVELLLTVILQSSFMVLAQAFTENIPIGKSHFHHVIIIERTFNMPIHLIFLSAVLSMRQQFALTWTGWSERRCFTLKYLSHGKPKFVCKYYK